MNLLDGCLRAELRSDFPEIKTTLVLPGVVAIMVLSWVYALFGEVPIVAALFFGLKAAVLAIVLYAVYRVGSRALKSGAMIGLAALGLMRGAIALGVMGALVFGVGGLARRQIGGYTGDVLGAFQQIGEIVMLLAASVR